MRDGTGGTESSRIDIRTGSRCITRTGAFGSRRGKDVGSSLGRDTSRRHALPPRTMPEVREADVELVLPFRQDPDPVRALRVRRPSEQHAHSGRPRISVLRILRRDRHIHNVIDFYPTGVEECGRLPSHGRRSLQWDFVPRAVVASLSGRIETLANGLQFSMTRSALISPRIARRVRSPCSKMLTSEPSRPSAGAGPLTVATVVCL